MEENENIAQRENSSTARFGGRKGRNKASRCDKRLYTQIIHLATAHTTPHHTTQQTQSRR
jgi:hypothetical protein